MANFNLAWKSGLKSVELDVRGTKDGKVVIIHDEDTLRVGGVNRKVKEQTLAELREINVGRIQGGKWDGERIPTLEEFLQAMPEEGELFLEIKGGPELIPELKNLLDQHPVPVGHLSIIGFSRDTMAETKRTFPEVSVYWICKFRDKKTGEIFPVESQVKKAQEAGLDGLDVQFCPEVDRSAVEKIKAAGMKLFVWTVDDPVEARQLVDAGVDGITSNRPLWLKEKLG